MAEHERGTGGKDKEVDRKRRNRQKEPESSFDQSLSWDTGPSSLTETPFYPRMDEHAAMLSRIPSAAQRNNFIMQLHQTYGNRYVQRLMESMDVQTKLTISEPGDIYEQEADRVADEVTRAVNSPTQLQADEEELLQGKSLIQQQPEEEEELQTQPDASQVAKVSDDIESRIDSARGGGQPLADNIHKPMEQAFGADFSDVRVHTDSEADMLNEKLSAKAFTTARDIFFRQGEYSPDSDSGRKLIAHELTHVVQQGNGQIDSGMSMKTKGENQKSYGQKNDNVIMRVQETRTIPKPSPVGDRETIVEWEADGLLSTIKAVTQDEGEDKERKAPTIFDEAYKETKTWRRGTISDVSAHGTDIYVYIKSPDKDIWQLSEVAGVFSLRPISETSSKRGDFKGRLKDFIKGTGDNTNKTAVANIIYENMLKKLKYKVGGVRDWKQIIEGKNEGECTAIAGTMLHAVKTALIVNGVSSDNLTDIKTITTGDKPFITREGCDSAKSVIKGKWSNICTKKDGDNISVYDGKLQKFDNHEWLEVSGSVYDLVAGIKGEATSCVGEDLTVITAGEEYSCSKGTIKKQTAAEVSVTKPKSPWPTGYTLEPPHA